MVPRLCRGLLVLALVPCLAGAAAVPGEHVHEGDADHHHAVAHRHIEPHEFGTHHHDEVEGANDEGWVVWLSNASLHQHTYHLSIDSVAVSLKAETLLDSTGWVAVPSYDLSPPHGPPRPSRSPRAPPLLHV